jgi:hypothetical protein
MTHFVLLLTLTPSKTYIVMNVNYGMEWHSTTHQNTPGPNRARNCWDSILLEKRWQEGALNTYLTVFSASDFANDFVVFLISPIDSQCFIIPIISRPMHVDIRIHPLDGGQGELNCY